MQEQFKRLDKTSTIVPDRKDITTTTDYYSHIQFNNDQYSSAHSNSDNTLRVSCNGDTNVELPMNTQARQPPPMPDFASCNKFTNHGNASIPPPPPPPPSTLNSTNGQPSINFDLVNVAPIKPNAKMKSLNWKKIPKRKVLSSVPPVNNSTTTNVWFLIAKTNNALKEVQPKHGTTQSTVSTTSTTIRHSKIREILNSVRRKKTSTQTQPTENDLQHQSKILAAIDFNDLEMLFCLPQQQQQQQLNQLNNSGLGIDSPGFVRRASVRTNASCDAFSSCDDQDRSSSEDQHTKSIPLNLLDSKKSLNVNIFLKQCRSSHESLIRLINEGNSAEIGKEKLDNLLKILPDTEEERSLRDVASTIDRKRLPLAETFLLRLVTKVPNYRLRLESLLLQEEYRTNFDYLKNSVKVVRTAALEIQDSQQFRDILNLVLVTGNFLNSGGYAADAAGFTLDCLGRLSEVRSNKQGIFLIHYVADIAEKLRLNNFIQEDLRHIEEASKVCIESLRADVKSITIKLAAINNLLNECELENDNDSENCISNHNDKHEAFFFQLQKFLDEIRLNVDGLRKDVTQGLEEVRVNLSNYLCEDVDSFKFSECFDTLLAFNQRLKVAMEENRRRRESEKRLEARKSFASRNDHINIKDFTKSNERSNCDKEEQQYLISNREFSKMKSVTTNGNDNVLIGSRAQNDLIELLKSTNIDISSHGGDDINFKLKNVHDPFGTFKRTKKGLKSTVQAYFKSSDVDAPKATKDLNHNEKRVSLLRDSTKLETLFSRERDSETGTCQVARSVSAIVTIEPKSDDPFEDVTNEIETHLSAYRASKCVTKVIAEDGPAEKRKSVSMKIDEKLEEPQKSKPVSGQQSVYNKNPTFSRAPPHESAIRRAVKTRSPIKDTSKNPSKSVSISQRNNTRNYESANPASVKLSKCKSMVNKIPVTNGIKVLPETFASRNQKKSKIVTRSHSITSQSSSKSGSTSSYASNKSPWISSTRVAMNGQQGISADKVAHMKSSNNKSSEFSCGKHVKNVFEQKKMRDLRKESDSDSGKLKRATSMKARLSGILNGGEASCGSSFMRPTSASQAKLKSLNSNASTAIR